MEALTKEELYKAVIAGKLYRTRAREVKKIVDITLDEIRKAKEEERDIKLED